MSKRTREEASPPRLTRTTGRDSRPPPAVERTPQPPVPAIQNVPDTDADSMALIAALLAEDGGRRTRTSVHLPVPINRFRHLPAALLQPPPCRPSYARYRERDHGQPHSRPESSSRHTAGPPSSGHHHSSSDPSAPKSDKKNRDRDRTSREPRPDPLQLSSMPAADAALKSPAPPAAAESSEPKVRSDRDRSGDRKRNSSSSSSKHRQEPKRAEDLETADGVVDDGQLSLTEVEAQAPKRVRRPVAASELAALNVDPKALESLVSDHGENEDDEIPKMMLRLRKRHDKDEKKEEHSDPTKGVVSSSAAAPSTPDAHNREDGEGRPKQDSSRRRSEGGDSKGGGSDRKAAPRRSEGDKSGPEKKDGSHKESHKSSSSSKKRRESSTPKCVEIKKQDEPSESEGEDDADKWVSCDRCKKWRKLPPAAEMPPKDKKVKWFCEMNILDPARANCAVPEEQWNVSGASVNTTNVDSKHNTIGSSPAAMAAKNQAAKNAAVSGKNVHGSKSGIGPQGKSNNSATLNSSANSVAETLLLYNSSHADSLMKDMSSNKNKAKGSNIGDAIVELLLYGGMPASVIEARLVDCKKLEHGAGGNQNKLSRTLQKLQRAGIVSKVIISDSSMFSHIYYAHALQERHQGTDDDQNIYCLAQEDLPDLLLSNHEDFFVKLNVLQPLPAVPAVSSIDIPSIPASAVAAAVVTSPKLSSKKAPAKVSNLASPLCSPPSTPRLQHAAASATAAVAVDLKLESGLCETTVENEEASSSMDMQPQPPPPAPKDDMPSSIEAQD